MLQDGKKQTLKAVLGKGSGGLVAVTTKVGEWALTITADGFTGTLGDMTVASKDVDGETGVISGTAREVFRAEIVE